MKRYTEINYLTEQIIGAAIDVHKHLGPGLLENVYHRVLACELELRGLRVESEKNDPTSL